jgi:hypothetical protein
MRSRRTMLFQLGFIAILSGRMVVACSDAASDCENTNSCDVGSGLGSGGGGNGPADACAPGPEATKIPMECSGFFLSANGSDAAEGTRDAPVLTFGRALELAVASAEVKRIYVCAEEFNEAVTVAAGIEIYGGLDCDNEWTYVGDTKKTIIAPQPDLVPLTLQSGEGTTVIADIEARAADAGALGGSSIAAIIDGVTASLVSSVLQAGAGANGDKGAALETLSPTSPDDPAIKGNAGKNACTDPSMTSGADAKTNEACPSSIGGKGGAGMVDTGANGEDGQPLPQDNPGGFGLGGTGTASFPCKNGELGLSGADGAAGAGSTEIGTLSVTGIAGAAGTDGDPGMPGQGGGGGGGAKGKVLCGGASGGSGGAGGCGGAGGKGGQAGGSSIALISLNAKLSFTELTLKTGAGGIGGEGGDGQIGGVGGTGGLGGALTTGTQKGCVGGEGGSGGAGGKGGGGRGGHSIAIAYMGDSPPDATFETGTPGEGGLGLDMAANGKPGVKADTQQF